MKKTLDLNEIRFKGGFWADQSGRLFEWEGELYRALSPSFAKLYKEIEQTGLLAKLIKKGLLIETEPTDLVLPGYGMVVKHRRIPFDTKCFEWSPMMIKDAALLILDLNIELAKEGFSTKDAHLWNVMFDGPHPVFVDLCSIISNENFQSAWPAYSEFCEYVLYPLQMMSSDEKGLVRHILLLHHIYGIKPQDFANLYNMRSSRQYKIKLRKKIWHLRLKLLSKLPQPMKNKLREKLDFFKNLSTRRIRKNEEDVLYFFEQLKNKVEGIRFLDSKTEWSNYDNSDFLPFIPSKSWKQKQQNVYELFKRLSPKTVFDIGCNKGWYSVLAANCGSQVVALDIDEPSIDWLYQYVKKKNLLILPVIMDFTHPTPGLGLDNLLSEPAHARLKCDMVLALSLVHHLVFKNRMSFSQIAEILSLFSNKYVIVEFIPSDDRYVREWDTEGFSWYTQENFVKSLSKYFSKIEILESYPPPRQLLHCEKFSGGL